MDTRLRALRVFYPEADSADWRLVDAGIRVQALKKSDAGRLSFGTEVVTAPDGSLAALLGASPGASVSAHIALQIIQTCFPDSLRTDDGHARMQAMIPTFDIDLASPAATADHARRSAQIDALLQLHHLSSTK
jgi:malate dehydrogenase (quinone)